MAMQGISIATNEAIILREQLGRLFRGGFGLEQSNAEAIARERLQEELTEVFMEYAKLRFARSLGIDSLLGGDEEG